jgi:hypothetical protein
MDPVCSRYKAKGLWNLTFVLAGNFQQAAWTIYTACALNRRKSVQR